MYLLNQKSFRLNKQMPIMKILHYNNYSQLIVVFQVACPDFFGNTGVLEKHRPGSATIREDPGKLSDIGTTHNSQLAK
jgi:hypothetical protein